MSPAKLVLGHLNINSIRNKFDGLSDLFIGNLDIFLVTETKIDESFPKQQFKLQGYAPPFRRDRTINGGGPLLYIREDIPSRVLNMFDNDFEFETILVEVRLRGGKWLLGACYNPHKRNIDCFFKKNYHVLYQL